MKVSRSILTAPELSRQKWLRHGFGTRKAVPGFRMPMVRLKQIHGDIVRVVDAPVEEKTLRGDAVITAVPGLAVAVASADCLPVLLADPENHVVAAIHAGWRGTLKRIVEKTVGVMRSRFGTDPAKLWAALGPSIHVCCYEVGPEVVAEFHSQFSYAPELFEKLDPENPALVMLPRQHLLDKRNAVMRDLDTQHAFLNVEEANARQLLDAGVPRRRILRGAPCTACRLDLMHSYRKEGRGESGGGLRLNGGGCGQQISAIGIAQ